jgi:hypothetical protein
MKICFKRNHVIAGMVDQYNASQLDRVTLIFFNPTDLQFWVNRFSTIF